jgi:AGZA family xanthine/uracil permease-like MFS transporter
LLLLLLLLCDMQPPGVVANYPWVVSTQLGTNSFFVNNVLGVQECGHHATMQGPDKACMGSPCR